MNSRNRTKKLCILYQFPPCLLGISPTAGWVNLAQVRQVIDDEDVQEKTAIVVTWLGGDTQVFYGENADAILCSLKEAQQRLETRITQMLSESTFKPYMAVFDKFGFGLRVRSRLLTRIYPFESFLGINGKPVIEYEVREVKKTERDAYGAPRPSAPHLPYAYPFHSGVTWLTMG